MRQYSRHIFLVILIGMLMVSSCQKSSLKKSDGDTLFAQAEAAFEEGDADKVCHLLQDALTAYQKEDNEEGMAASWLALAQVRTNELLIDTAMSYVDKALTLHVGDSMRAALLGEKGSIYIIKGDLRLGVHHVRRAIQEFGSAYQGEDKALGCGNAAIACRRLGMSDSARYFFEEGIRAAQQVGDDEELAFLYNSLCIFFAELKRFDEGLVACHKAYEAAVRAGNEEEAMNARANEGVIWNRKGDSQKGIHLLEDLWLKVKGIDNAVLKTKTLTYLLQASVQQGDKSRIGKYLDMSEQFIRQMPKAGIQASGLIEVMTDINIGKGDYAAALQLLEQVDTAALNNGTYPRDAFLRQKAGCMAGMGNYHQAYDLTLRSVETADSLKGLDAQRQITELSEQLKAQERETEIARLNKAVAQRQLFAVILATGLVILALLAAVYVYWQRKRKEQSLAQRYVEGLERERARFARELHDGACNELLGIGMVINTQKAEPKEVAQRISQLRDTLRHISHELMPPQFDKATLDEILRYYLQHIKSPSVDVRFSSQGDFSVLPKHIAYELYRITQEAVGNILSHASATLAQVDVRCDRREVTLRVSDNGCQPSNDDRGETVARTISHDGIGLRSVSDRAKSIGGNLRIDSNEQGTTVTLTAPL